jgi:hypothetical protein
MNPVVATSLINLGSNIVNKAFSSAGEPKAAPAEDFETKLRSFQNKPIDAAQLEGIKNELLQSPELKSFIEKNTNCTISLDQLSDGSIRVLSSSGDFLTLNKESLLLAKADQFLNASLKNSANLNPERANSVILTG